MSFDQDPQTLGVEPERIAHPVILDADRTLPRPAGRIGKAEFVRHAPDMSGFWPCGPRKSPR